MLYLKKVERNRSKGGRNGGRKNYVARYSGKLLTAIRLLRQIVNCLSVNSDKAVII